MNTNFYTYSNEDLGYDKPPEWRGNNLISIYTPIPRNSGRVNFDIYDYNMLFNDEATKELIRTGNTIGCFYIESPSMRMLLRKLNVETFELLTAASSIIRPGVAESGMMQEFILRHKNPERRKYLVPEMEEILGETYGVMVYQEDVIKVAHHIAGLTMVEADLLRRAMSGKLRSRKAMEELTWRFYSSCKERGLPREATLELWRQIESFAGYAFCKAHSASFALLSFQVAYLKAHHPAEFMASVLSNHGGYYAPGVYVQECKRLGLKVELPSINESESDYTGEGKTVRIGLSAIKHLSQKAIDNIIAERKANGRYTSLGDFVVRTGTGFEDTVLLIKCGAMGCLKKTRPALLRMLDIYMKRRKIQEENYGDLFINETFALEEEMQTEENYTVEEICAAEYEAFDYMVTRHPLYFVREFSAKQKVIRAVEMEKYKGRKVKMIGWYMTSKRIKTKKGDIMKFLSLEDESGTFEAVMFPKVYSRVAEKTMSMGPYIVEGFIDADDNRNIVVENLEVLSALNLKTESMWDSVENKYYGDNEKIEEGDYLVLSKQEAEKMRKAYVA